MNKHRVSSTTLERANLKGHWKVRIFFVGVSVLIVS